ncbi:MAG: hypothetical protein HYX87_07485 [Chloroflexi bacterium]|nr:hypothetical protein [Chloroflexota bacterium]
MAGMKMIITNIRKLLLDLLEQAIMAEEPEIERVCVAARAINDMPQVESREYDKFAVADGMD